MSSGRGCARVGVQVTGLVTTPGGSWGGDQVFWVDFTIFFVKISNSFQNNVQICQKYLCTVTLIPWPPYPLRSLPRWHMKDICQSYLFHKGLNLKLGLMLVLY